jgi:hypothetical protein
MPRYKLLVLSILTFGGGLYAQVCPQGYTSSGGVCVLAVPQVVASGTAALGTSAIASGACATVVTSTATGALTSDAPIASFSSDPTAVTGYAPSTSGTLTIYIWPAANTFNAKVCNSTASSITPGALTLNWRVVR